MAAVVGLALRSPAGLPRAERTPHLEPKLHVAKRAITPADWKIFPEQIGCRCVVKAAVPHRENHPTKTSVPGSQAPWPKKEIHLARQVARGALLAVSFSALQYFNEEGFESKRLFDPRVVDSLRAPLTHYHE